MVPEVSITIDRSDTRPLVFAFKTGVAAPSDADLTGSAFALRIINMLGTELLSAAGQIDQGRVSFNLSLEQRALIPAGRTCRYEVLRQIAESQEPWVRGGVIAVGGVSNG